MNNDTNNKTFARGQDRLTDEEWKAKRENKEQKETFDSYYNKLDLDILDSISVTTFKMFKQLHDLEKFDLNCEISKWKLFNQEKDKQIQELNNNIFNLKNEYMKLQYENDLLENEKCSFKHLLNNSFQSNLIEQQRLKIEVLQRKLDIFERFPNYENLLKEKDNEIYDLQEEIKYLENTDKGKLMVEIKNLINIQNMNLGQLNKRRDEIYKLQNEVTQLKEYIEGNK